MKIILPNNYFGSFDARLAGMLIKIIKVGPKSSLISLNGRKIEIPYYLNPGKRYRAFPKDGSIEIIEIPQKNKKLFENKNSNKEVNNLLEKLFTLKNNKENNLESLIKNFLFNLFYSKITINDDYLNKKSFKSYYFRNADNEEYYFFFNLFYFDRISRIFIKIDKSKNVFFNVFAEGVESLNNDYFIDLVNNSIKGNVRSFYFDFCSDIEGFLKKINSLMINKNVDIKI